MLKGFDKFRSKIPSLKGGKIILLPVYALFILCLAFSILIIFDSLPGLLSQASPLFAFLPLAGIILLGVLSLLLVWQMWWQRDRLKKKYGKTSYQRIFFLGFGGVLMLFSLSWHQFVPYYSLSAAFWASSPFAILATPLDLFCGSAGLAVMWIKIILSVVLGLCGVLLAARAVTTFGVDYMTVVYLYFPEESKIRKNEIYSALRHPAYAAVLLVALAGTILALTIFSLIAFLLFLFGFWIHIRFVEEKELINRFGNSYRTYRKQVPPFFTWRLGSLFRFLFGIKAKKRHSAK